MTQSPSRSTPVHESWVLLVPPGWDSIPTDPERARSAVRAIGERIVRGQARDELVHGRIAVERALLAQVERARRTGAAALHVLTSPIRDLPVSASLLVAELPVGGDRELQRRLEAVLGGAEGVLESGIVDLQGVSALRRRRRVAVEDDQRDSGSSGNPGEPAPSRQLWQTCVDYVVEVTPDDLLVLSFSTVTDAIAEELVLLFDAMAESLHQRA